MKYNSVKEYFYKLNNAGYLLMMPPVIIFILHYSQPLIDLSFLEVDDPKIHEVVLSVTGCLAILMLLFTQVYTYRKASAIARQVGLGIKLEKLGSVLITKMKLLAFATGMMPAALLFTNHNYFNFAFVILLVWYFIQWPVPWRVCRLLKLKGDERELVISRGEAFRGV